jgi:cell pole-organizing protein PopZ
MSKPDSTGESLESILASIRRSLSEQSTDVLEEDVAATSAPEDAGRGALRSDGLAGRLAGTAEDALQVAEAAPGDGLGAPLEVPPPAAPLVPPGASVAPAAPPAASGPTVAKEPKTQKDPLWFLGRGQQAAKESERRPVADGQRAAAAGGRGATAESKAARAEVVRGPLPPFFGSSAEVAKVEVVPAEPVSPGAGVLLPPVPQPVKVPDRPAREPETVRDAPRPPTVTGATVESVRNGKDNSLFGHGTADHKTSEQQALAGPPPGVERPHVHALEAMVLELLRPMLQRWLDENMPRLVSAALKDHAARMSERDPKRP